MHLRGTHCGRSGRKNQISRAQCRVKSGTARGEAERSVEETIPGAVAGKVHAIALARRAVKSIGALAETGVTGSGTASGVAGATQQQRQASFGAQQLHTGSVEVVRAVESVWADAITWSQITVRLRMKATARFMVLSYGTYRWPAKRCLRFARHFLSDLPAAASFLRYLAGALLNVFWQDLQQSLIS